MQFNKLTDKEHEALTILFEECSEVVQIVGKILRHGLESHHPTKDRNPFTGHSNTNRIELAKECGDVRAAMKIVVREGILVQRWIDMAIRDKTRRFREHPEYLHHIDPL